MRYLALSVVIFFGCFFTSFAHAEEITNFDSNLEVQADGHVLVTETIQYDFGGVERHGIYRVLNTKHPQAASVWYKKRSIAYSLVSVTVDATAVAYSISHSAQSDTIKIGDADVLITGKHTYVITYEMDGALSYGSSGAELYYNATGYEWLVPIVQTAVRVSDPTGTLLAPKAACYEGSFGENSVCASKTMLSDSTQFTAGYLPQGQGLTIAQEIHAEKVAVLIHESISLMWLVYTFGGVWLIFLFVWAVRHYVQFKIHRPVVAQYEPYAGVLPMYMGVLFDDKLDPRDITAGIIYLAQQGFIKITRTEDKVFWIFDSTDYAFTLLRAVSEMPVSALQSLLAIFFLGVPVGTTVRLSELKASKVQNAQAFSHIADSLRQDLVTEGFILSTLSSFTKVNRWRRFWVIVFAIVFVLYMQDVVVTCIVLISLVIPFIANYRRRTILGYEASNHLKGFKLFLSVTEAERYKFFNAPAKNPEVFMQYLPYAVAFVVENEWANAFAGITIPNPGWYDGGSVQTFSALALTSDLGNFSTTFAASSGTSGSSGGGFSGGGGGGGGGGSW